MSLLLQNGKVIFPEGRQGSVIGFQTYESYVVKADFLTDFPDNEKLMMLLPVGFPAADATVPDIQRKPVEDYLVHL